MVYMNKFVMAVKVDGNFLEERANGAVPIPFNSEYSLRFRNKNNRRAVVKFFIDGENVSGDGYVIPANGHIEIERHANTPNRFKFVSLDSGDAIDFGKNGPNTNKQKGVIVAQFFLEKDAPKITYTPPIFEHHYHHHHYPRPRHIGPYYYGTPQWNLGDSMIGYNECDSDGTATFSTSAAPASAAPMSQTRSKGIMRGLSSSNFCGYVGVSNSVEPAGVVNTSLIGDEHLKDGCTVEGSESDQRFTTVSIDVEDTATEVKIFLQGFDPDAVTTVEIKPAAKPMKRHNMVPTKDNRKVMFPTDDLRKFAAGGIDLPDEATVEAENARLKAQLELLEENAKLKARIAELQKSSAE